MQLFGNSMWLVETERQIENVKKSDWKVTIPLHRELVSNINYISLR